MTPQPPAHTPAVIGTKEVARLLDVSERTAARLLAEGEIRAFKMHGKLWRTTLDLVYEYISSQIAKRSRS